MTPGHQAQLFNPDISESKIFIACIPHGATESNLRSMLAPFGRVTYFFYHQDPADSGFVFATFESRDQAEAAVQNIHETSPFADSNSRPLFCKLANQKLYTLPKPKAAPIAAPTQEVPTHLPAPWKEFQSPEGYPYYHNAETGETTWTHPGLGASLAIQDEPSSSQAGENRPFTMGPVNSTLILPADVEIPVHPEVPGLLASRVVGNHRLLCFQTPEAATRLGETLTCAFLLR